jgi:hypothetical protein
MITAEKAMTRHADLAYKILYHKKGYIRLEVPSLKKLSWAFLFTTFKITPPFPLHAAINDLHVNPLTGNLVINYEPDGIDILDYIQKMASDPKVKNLMKGSVS